MALSMQGLATEIYARIDQVEGLPRLKKSGLFEIVKSSFDIISQALAAGETVIVPRFGKFEVIVRGARKGRNPHTGEVLSIAEKNAMKFRPSSTLRALVAEGSGPEVAKATPGKVAKKEGKKETKKKAKKK